VRDPWLVVGCLWSIYLGARLVVEAARVVALPRIAAAGRPAVAASSGPEDGAQAEGPARQRKRKWSPLPAILWLAGEAAIAVAVVGAVWLVLRGLNVELVPAAVAEARDDSRRQFAVAVMLGWSLLVVNVPLAWRLVGRILPAESQKSQGGVDPERMGGTIGVLERILVIALVPSGPAGVGFVIAAKTLARFKELNKKRFAERYLLGTMTSVTIAILSAYAAGWIWTSL
jgi:hypothetical protein